MHPAINLSRGDSIASGLRVRRLGRCSYDDALAMQERAARAVAAGGPDELLYVEHAPLITLGRGTDPGQIISSAAELAVAGISVVDTDRGGGATYHGPGQLVGYPIVDLRRRAIGVRTYLHALERALVTTLRGNDVDAFVRANLTGVWTSRGKVAAIGVAVRRGISRHGFAVNVTTDLAAFHRIVPCGLREPVTSLRELGWEGEATTLQPAIARALEAALDDARSVYPARAAACISQPARRHLQAHA